MRNIIAENMDKLIAAGSAEETAKILRAAGEDISPEEAGQLFKEIKERFPGGELLPDELEAVSGGADRDWATDGCAGTVEGGSWCGSNDACHVFDVTYLHLPSKMKCRKCGGDLVTIITGKKNGNVRRCKECGLENLRW